MRICDINPHIRLAEQINYDVKENSAFVCDSRIFYVISGMAEIFIENQHFLLQDNSLFYCCAGITYTIKLIKELSLLALNFDLTQNRNSIVSPLATLSSDAERSGANIERCEVSDSDFLGGCIFFEHGSEFLARITDIISSFSRRHAYFRETSSCILKEILIDLHIKNTQVFKNKSDVIDLVLTYINNNYKKPITNKSIAALVGYHEYHLNRLFLKRMGTGIHRYIIDMRIDEAKRLLLNSNLPLSQISEQVGFSNNTYFSNCFSKKIGISPSNFRKEFKNNI